MNIQLLKYTLKRNWKFLAIFFCVMMMYLSILIGMINPEDMQKIKDLFGTMGSFLSAFGINTETMTDPLSYTASTFFGMLVMCFSMIYYLIVINLLIVKPVDDNSLAYDLSLPISRTKFLLTQIFYLVITIFVLYLGILIVGSIMLNIMGNFDFNAYLNLVGVTFCLNIMIAMACLLLAIVFCTSKKANTIIIGFPIGLLLLSMLGGAGGEKIAWLKRITPFGWIESVDIVNHKVSTWWMYLIFILGTFIIGYISIWCFKRKKLPI